ncbi:MAG: ctpA [Phycisphaerales bacterium]|nr:ctpA [Phycisphaerales bacterium]
MNREKITWMVSGAVLAALALNVPGSLAQRDSDYKFVRTLVDIYRQVGTNYVENVDEPKLQNSAINGMLATLDPYTMFVPEDQKDAFNDALDGNFKGVGVQLNQNPDSLQIEVVTPIDDSPAWKAGVLPGDILEKVDGTSVIGQRLEGVDGIISKIKGPNGSKVTLGIRRGEKYMEFSMVRAEFIVPQVKGFERNADNSWNYFADTQKKIAYIRLKQFTPDIGKQITDICQKLLDQGMKGLVFDLRFNPGGRLEEAEQLIDLFVKEGVIVTVKGRNRPEQKSMAKAEGTLPDFPMVVLVNEHSASASEVMAGALKDNKRSVVVGARTYGKGSVQEVMPLDGHSGELKITVAYWYLPSGKRVQRLKDAKEWGVEPDFVVPMDDEAQERLAIQQIKSESMRVTLNTPATTRSANGTTVPTTQSIDPQMDKALEVLRDKLK